MSIVFRSSLLALLAKNSIKVKKSFAISENIRTFAAEGLRNCSRSAIDASIMALA